MAEEVFGWAAYAAFCRPVINFTPTHSIRHVQNVNRGSLTQRVLEWSKLQKESARYDITRALLPFFIFIAAKWLGPSVSVFNFPILRYRLFCAVTVYCGRFPASLVLEKSKLPSFDLTAQSSQKFPIALRRSVSLSLSFVLFRIVVGYPSIFLGR